MLKKISLKIVCLVLFLIALPFVLLSEELLHVIQKGETLYSISRKYSISADVLTKYNTISDPSKLQAGQKIRIPSLYVVKKGDTLYGIARSLQIPIDDLLQSNGLTKNSLIKAGDTLFAPTLKNTPPSSTGIAKVDTTSSVLPLRPIEDPRLFETKKIDSSIIWPVQSNEISYLTGKIYGVTIKATKGEPVKTIASGTVLSTGPYRGFGQVVFVQSKSGYIYVYGGLENIIPEQGKLLGFGETLGLVGNDSLSGKPRVYLMVYNKDIPVDPAKAPRGY